MGSRFLPFNPWYMYKGWRAHQHYEGHSFSRTKRTAPFCYYDPVSGSTCANLAGQNCEKIKLKFPVVSYKIQLNFPVVSYKILMVHLFHIGHDSLALPRTESLIAMHMSRLIHFTSPLCIPFPTRWCWFPRVFCACSIRWRAIPWFLFKLWLWCLFSKVPFHASSQWGCTSLVL